MSAAKCQLCLDLFDRAQVAIREHIEASTCLSKALEQNALSEEVTALEAALEEARHARSNAVMEYKKHEANHSQSAVAAG